MFNISTASSPDKLDFRKNKVLQFTSLLFFCIWCWTLIDVADMTNWTLENVPVFVCVAALVVTYRRFRFSDLSYICFCIFLALHIYGAKHIYAMNPFGAWLQELLGTSRNHYDRIIHFVFGLLIFYPARDLCLNYLKLSPRLSLTIPVLICLSLGSLYEVLEWVVVDIFFPEHGVNFLGIQGDVWDPQKDIFLAMIGAVCSALLVIFIKRVRSSGR